MKILAFSNPEFRLGRNITCRRGVKWACETQAFVKGIGAVSLSSQVLRFCDLTDEMLSDEHDAGCRTVVGLWMEMGKLYSNFDRHEIVTLVSFINPGAPTT